jgi:hypothetical protein
MRGIQLNSIYIFLSYNLFVMNFQNSQMDKYKLGELTFFCFRVFFKGACASSTGELTAGCSGASGTAPGGGG